MTLKELITPEILKEHFSYNENTGGVVWVKPTAQRVKVGDKAGYLGVNRYYTIDFCNHKFLLHRLIWALYYGYWPPNHVDHINRDPSDNRIVNLRLATREENMRNMNSHKGSLSTYKGVSWNKRAKKWQARIYRCGKSYYLGVFKTEKEAAEAYNNFDKEYSIANQI